MIKFYYAPTPNGWKVAIMLEECKLEYTIKLLSIETGEQFDPSFLEINPNAKIPAIIDYNPLKHLDSNKVNVFESKHARKWVNVAPFAESSHWRQACL